MGKVAAMKKWQRLNLDMTPSTIATLHEVERRIAATSRTETVRFCVHTMARILEEVESGGQLLVKRADGKVVRILLAWPTVKPS